MPKNADICIVLASTSPRQKAGATALAEKLDLALHESFANSYPYHLVYTDIRLELQHNPNRIGNKEKPIYVDFVPRGSVHQRLLTASVKDPLCKAVGIKRGKRPSVVDATAGLGIDGVTLAWLGCSVILIERAPVVHALLQDGLRRAAEDERLRKIIDGNLTLLEGNSTAILTDLPSPPDTVLVDPMYPLSAKEARNKKEMRMLRDIVGADIDSRDLFSAALRAAGKRVVVKRPKGSDFICKEPRPSHQILMKSGRFDVYLKDHL
jgi:16S rRNA (guanine1516-N2)-methyltransferase